MQLFSERQTFTAYFMLNLSIKSKKNLFIPHIIHIFVATFLGFRVYEIDFEVGCILRQPLFLLTKIAVITISRKQQKKS